MLTKKGLAQALRGSSRAPLHLPLGQLPSSEVLIQHRWLARQRETEKAKADTQFWFCLVCSVVGMLLAFHQRGWRPLLGSGLRDKPAAGWGAELNLRCAAAADRRCLVRRAPALCRASCLFELLASSYKFDCMHAATTTRKFLAHVLLLQPQPKVILEAPEGRRNRHRLAEASGSLQFAVGLLIFRRARTDGRTETDRQSQTVSISRAPCRRREPRQTPSGFRSSSRTSGPAAQKSSVTALRVFYKTSKDKYMKNIYIYTH